MCVRPPTQVYYYYSIGQSAGQSIINLRELLELAESVPSNVQSYTHSAVFLDNFVTTSSSSETLCR